MYKCGKKCPIQNIRLIDVIPSHYAIINEEDYTKVSQYKWYLQKGKQGRLTAITSVYLGKINGKYKRKTILMSRMILNASKNELVDHKNHYCLDATRENIRLCSRAENNANRIKRKKGKSIYKGVFQVNDSSRWYAIIGGPKNRKYLGSYKTEEKAAIAYNKAVKKRYGEFALFNSIGGPIC